MKNICFQNTTGFWGGGEKLHLEYAIQFRDRGYRVFLICKKEGQLHQEAVKHGLLFFNLSTGNLSFLNPFKIFRLFRFLKKERIDTLIFSSSPDLKTGGIAAKLARVEKILYLRGLAVPVKDTWLNRFLYTNVLTHIVVNSEETKKTILKNLSGTISAGFVKVIYHGIDLKVYDQSPKASLYQKADGIILGNAGRLTEQKGQIHLVEVARKLKQDGISFKMYIAGTGELNEKLIERIRKFDLQNEVILSGFIRDMNSFMHSIDIFLLSSVWEGFGYVIVEAMAAKKPVVAFDISSNHEIIENNETGFLVSYPDVEQFTHKTAELIRDDSLRKTMGEKGRKRVEALFQLGDRISEFEQYLLTREKEI